MPQLVVWNIRIFEYGDKLSFDDNEDPPETYCDAFLEPNEDDRHETLTMIEHKINSNNKRSLVEPYKITPREQRN